VVTAVAEAEASIRTVSERFVDGKKQDKALAEWCLRRLGTLLEWRFIDNSS
jgi:uncharacterized protein YycO